MNFLRSASAPSLLTLLLPAVAVLVLSAWSCGGPPEEATAAGPAQTGQSQSAEEAATMAPEHVGDRPVASEAATTEPATAVVGDPVIYGTGTGSADGEEITGYLARPENATGPLPGLLVIHEWWGLNDNIRAMTRRLAGEGYVALAVDLYGGQVADTPDKARELMSSVDPDRAIENLRQARAYLAEQLKSDGGPGGRIGVIGWCFGGGWSLRTALAMPDGIDATVIYYGHLTTDRSELAKLDSPVLGLFGAEDGSIPPDQVHAFEEALETLGKPVEVKIYDGAGHAFANPSGERYRPEAAQDAWRRTVAFLAKNLSGAAGG